MHRAAARLLKIDKKLTGQCTKTKKTINDEQVFGQGLMRRDHHVSANIYVI
jgi:hypothetical protein